MATMAIQAGLHYEPSFQPGIIRQTVRDDPADPKKFHYVYTDANGNPVTDPEVLAPLEALKIPPGQSPVRYSPDPLGHIQAKGRDAHEKDQYTYHPVWDQISEREKYQRISRFSEALPEIRRSLERDLSLPGMPLRKVKAAAVKMLGTTLIRIGNEESAKKNGNYGLTTLLKSQVIDEGGSYSLSFRGKSYVPHTRISVPDSLTAFIHELLLLPGELLLQFVGDRGKLHGLQDSDVNDYIKEISGGSFSAKDFRTWMGTVYAAEFLYAAGVPTSEREANKTIKAATEYVASKLGNDATTSRESYISPGIINSYREQNSFNGAFSTASQRLAAGATGRTLAEEAVLILLGNSQ